MEILIFIIIACVIAYFVYNNLSETQFQKGVNLLQQGNTSLALEKFTELKEKHDQAGLKVAEIKFQIAQKLIQENHSEKAVSALKEVLEIRKGIKRNTINKKGLVAIEVKTSGEIAKIHYQKAQDFLKNGDTISAYSSFEEALLWCNEDTQIIKINSFIELAKIDYQNGVKGEKVNNFKSAIADYQKALSHFQSIEKSNFYYNVKSRIEICKFKQNITPDKVVLDELTDKNISSKNDLMFRYALYLAQNNEIPKCENVLSKCFHNSNVAEVIKIKTFCKEFYIEQAVKAIENINQIIFGENYEKSLQLYNQFDKIIPIIKKGLPNLLKEVEKIKSYLFSKLINQYFDNEAFEKLISHIASFPNFYEQPELLKNIGIACLRLANDNKITISNYQIIISTWLSAVYSDKVMLSSLDATTWDDDYTFTLIDSIGSQYIFENEVENVNFDDVSDDNISIGYTQKELVSIFESALDKISDAKLSKQAQDFYNAEKQALEKIIQTISTEIVYVPPYFAIQHNLNSIVLEHLALAFEDDQDMSILESGLRYVKDKAPIIFEHYKTAESFMSVCINAIKQKSVATLQSQNNNSNKAALNKFPALKKGFEEQMIRAFGAITDKESENENIIPLFEEVINLSPNKEQLKYQCANFITDLSIAKINNDKMKNERGLELLIKAYQLNSDSSRVTHNLAIVAKFNCMDMLNNGISTVCKTKLQELVKIKNALLTQNLRSELLPVYNGILRDIGKNNPNLLRLIKAAIEPPTISNIDDLLNGITSLNGAGLELVANLKLIKSLTEQK